MDGETGFVCTSIEEAVDAVGRVKQISREGCRAHVEANFSADLAVARHESLYRAMLRETESQLAPQRILAAPLITAPGPFLPARVQSAL
jgi:hypothetical protein